MKQFFLKVDDFYRKIIDYFTRPGGKPTIFHPKFLSKHFLEKRMKSIAGEASGILLDVGCGKSPYKSIFDPYIEMYVGLEYPSTSVHDDTEKLSIFASADSLPLQSQSVETVLSTGVIEHVQRPGAFLKEANRVLKDSGKLILSAPQSYPVHHPVHDYYRYTHLGLQFLLEDNGFNAYLVIQNGHFWVYWLAMWNHYMNYRLFRNAKNLFIKLLLSGIGVILTPVLIIITGIVNSLALMLDLIDTDPSFTLDYTILAKKIN